MLYLLNKIFIHIISIFIHHYLISLFIKPIIFIHFIKFIHFIIFIIFIKLIKLTIIFYFQMLLNHLHIHIHHIHRLLYYHYFN